MILNSGRILLQFWQIILYELRQTKVLIQLVVCTFWVKSTGIVEFVVELCCVIIKVCYIRNNLHQSIAKAGTNRIMSQRQSKQTKWHVCPVSALSNQSSLSSGKRFGSLTSYKGHSEDYQTGQIPGWSESSLDAQVIMLLLSCSGCNFNIYIL